MTEDISTYRESRIGNSIVCIITQKLLLSTQWCRKSIGLGTTLFFTQYSVEHRTTTLLSTRSVWRVMFQVFPDMSWITWQPKVKSAEVNAVKRYSWWKPRAPEPLGPREITSRSFLLSFSGWCHFSVILLRFWHIGFRYVYNAGSFDERILCSERCPENMPRKMLFISWS